MKQLEVLSEDEKVKIRWNIAEYLGWTSLGILHPGLMGERPDGEFLEVPDYFSSTTDALTLFEKMHRSAGVIITVGDGGYPHVAIHGDEDAQWYSSYGFTWPDALCRAWFKWQLDEEDE